MEAIGLLAGGVAHDFNNHLTIILGCVDIISMDMSEHNPIRHRIEAIGKAANSSASLTRQLLTFSRKQVVHLKIICLNDVLTGLEKILQRLIREDIRFVTVKSPDLAPINMDPGQLEQVIMNLVVNARDAMPKGGTLTIKTANVDLDEAFFKAHGPQPATGPYMMLSVSDSGIGMDKETQSRIFEPFFTTKEKGKGTGLGLATVYGIVKQAKGYAWVYSEPGKGTTFKVYIPRSGGGEAMGVMKRPESPVTITGTETILLAEDDDVLRNLMDAVLKGHGYRVLVAEDGKAALALSEKHEGEIELLLADVVLPVIGGKDLSDTIQEKRPHMKVLFLSGYTDDTIASYGVVPSEVNFLEKPFTLKSLALNVREVLDR
jgi:two-component system, cell cycle sensor histidine kinase and response regulator CckA